MPVAGGHWHVSDEFDRLLDSVDAGHGLVRDSVIDEVFGMWVTVHGAAAVDHETESAVAADGGAASPE